MASSSNVNGNLVDELEEAFQVNLQVNSKSQFYNFFSLAVMHPRTDKGGIGHRN